jgi:type II secretory pathway pseudopilin PulG
MKLLSNLVARSPAGRRHGFTLVETMVSLWIFIIIFIGVVIAVQVFGLRVYSLGATKLSATACAVKVLNQIRDDIRASKTIDVGNLTTAGSPATFALPGPTVGMAGGALRICPTTNTVPYEIYYLDTSTTTNYLKMATTTNGTTFGAPVVLASYVTNAVVFEAEDFAGRLLTNNVNNHIIRMELDFYQWEYPIGVVGGVGYNAYDFYKLTTRISRRLID